VAWRRGEPGVSTSSPLAQIAGRGSCSPPADFDGGDPVCMVRRSAQSKIHRLLRATRDRLRSFGFRFPSRLDRPMTPDLHTLILGRDAMGCRFEVVFNAGEHPDATELGIAALDVVDAVEDRLTVYRDTSELARLNATAASGWQPVSEELLAVLTRARRLHDATGGAFDIAAGALVRTWGFLRRAGRVPDAEALAIARAASGMHLLEIDAAARRVRFARGGVELNPGAIGKGLAIDAAIDHLAAAGVVSVLVHGGQSSVRALGIQGPAVGGRHGWRVGLAHPARPGRRLATFTLVDRALGTSGSGTQFFLDRGRRLGHILDPRTGEPADGVLSATVLAPCAADADALATALYVLGRDGLARVAPRDSGISAVLVEPAAGAAVRLVLANVPAEAIRIDEPSGVVVEDTTAAAGKTPNQA
jgi:thiamine biosynthesis lipoprotein